MRIVIVEDEVMTTEDLADDLKAVVSNCEIVKTLSSVKEAICYFSANSNFDLIFSDIQLGDGLSFEIYDKVKISSPIIFCTAHNDYAIEAFKANGIDYIFKPFNKESVAKAIDKYQKLKNNFSSGDVSFQKLIEQLKPISASTILVYQRDKIIPISTSNIALFFLQNALIKAVTFESIIYTIDKSLEEIEKIAGANFFRVNRQFLIQRSAIKDVSQHFNRKLIVNLNVLFSEQVSISKERSPLFLKWLAEN